MTLAKNPELCAPAHGPIMAYAGQRAADRFTTAGERRHAVTLTALLAQRQDPDTGQRLYESECGRDGYVEVGPWDPADPLNCRRCAKFIAGLMPIPNPRPRRRPVEVPAPVEVPVLVGSKGVQLGLVPEPEHVPRPPRAPRPPARPAPLLPPPLFADVA